jgi:hypothetical protein
MFTKVNVPILGIMILFVEVHKSVFIVMQIRLAVWMIANPHYVFIYLLGNGEI